MYLFIDIRQRHNANSSGDNSNPSKPHVRTSQPTNQQQRAGGVLAPNNSIVATATGVLQSTGELCILFVFVVNKKSTMVESIHFKKMLF